jgi:hypothetical protein
MKFVRVLFSVFIVLCFLDGCRKMPPQLPANKNLDTTDNEVVALAQLNERMAIKEDSLLKEFVKKLHGNFIKSPIGVWYFIENQTNGTTLKNSDSCCISWQMFSLEGKLLGKESCEKIVIGKKQIPVGLEEGLRLLHKGENAVFVVPWYLAYGMKGLPPDVPPYTSLIYKVKFEK